MDDESKAECRRTSEIAGELAATLDQRRWEGLFSTLRTLRDHSLCRTQMLRTLYTLAILNTALFVFWAITHW